MPCNGIGTRQVSEYDCRVLTKTRPSFFYRSNVLLALMVVRTARTRRHGRGLQGGAFMNTPPG